MSEKQNKEQLQEDAVAEDKQGQNQENTTLETEGVNPDPKAESSDNEADEGSDLQKEYEKMKGQYDETKDKYLRLLAEFDNFKKRTVREKMDFMRSAAQDTMSALLPVLDDFDRAKKAADSNDKGDLFNEGVGLVYQKLYTTLKQKGLKPMETDGQPFDPELHEALTEIPAPAEELKGHIVDTVEKGYWLNDKIIRHAKVVVGK
jgi:molecular chaperone GrpE